MVRTRGAARKAANSLTEGESAQHDDVSTQAPMISKRHPEKKTGSQKDDQPNEDASVAKAVEVERELTEEPAGLATRRGKLGVERSVKVKEEGTALWYLNTLDSLMD